MIIRTREDLEKSVGFKEGWPKCRDGLVAFLVERTLLRARAGDTGSAKELAALVEELREIGFPAAAPDISAFNPPPLKSMPFQPTMQKLHNP